MMDAVKVRYLRNRRLRALLLSTGIACLVASFGVASLFMLLPTIQAQDASVLASFLDKIVRIESHEFVDFSFSDKHILAPFSYLVMLVIGIMFLSRAKSDREEFIDAYRHLDFSYSREEMDASSNVARKYFWLGGLIGAVGIILFFVLHALTGDELAIGLGCLVLAAGIWFIVYGANSRDGIDLLIYNYEALRIRSIYSLEQATDDPDYELILAIKRLQLRVEEVKRVIIVIGALGTAALYFLPTLHTSYYWVPLAAALIICFIFTHYQIRKTRVYYQRTSRYERTSTRS